MTGIGVWRYLERIGVLGRLVGFAPHASRTELRVRDVILRRSFRHLLVRVEHGLMLLCHDTPLSVLIFATSTNRPRGLFGVSSLGDKENPTLEVPDDLEQIEECQRCTGMKHMRPGTLAAIVLAIAAIVFVGYSFVVTERVNEGATTTGTSTRPKEPGSIQDLPATNKPKAPLVDSNVPPATQSK